MPSHFSRYFTAWVRYHVVACAAIGFLTWASAAISAPPAISSQPTGPDFNLEIRPILSRSCFKCHGPDDTARKAGMRLDLRAIAVKPTESGSVPIVPGKTDESEVVARIFADDADTRMPPAAANVDLTPGQKELLKRWIAAGAEYKPHWSFVPPRQAPLPLAKAGHTDHWARNPIDAFVLARVEAAGLSPSPEADPYALLRRVSLDLIGLPPTPAEVDAVLAEAAAAGRGKSKDPALALAAWDTAYEHYVDRLLASPHYGERWARRWLDLARYADTNGYEKDRPRIMWPYRDWVIKAFNDDMPFDRFTIEQIAGDMLPKPTIEQRIATGFHRNTMLNEEGGADPLEYRFYAMTDRVGTTATTWLGLTMMCAQCHTHKYDPITHKEYYQFMALLDNADEPVMDIPTPDIEARRKEHQREIDKQIAALPSEYPVDAVHWLALGGKSQVITASGAAVADQGDGSWKVTGKTAETDVYTVTFDGDGTAFDSLRLEAIRDKKSGPGRTPHGNFVLTDLRVAVAPRGQPQSSPSSLSHFPAADAPISVPIVSAQADFAQDRFPVENAFDRDPTSGWAIDGAGGVKSRSATFQLNAKVVAKAAKSAGGFGLRWTITLAQNYGGRHTLGHMRLSLGDSDRGRHEQSRSAALAKGFGAWLNASRKQAGHWKVLRPLEARANVPVLSIEPDDSIFVGGDITKSDKYRLKFRTDVRGVTAIRLEVLPDDRLPRHGPGRIFYEGSPGNFFLSEITLTQGGKPQRFGSATQTFSSPGNPAQHAIDGDPQSGWSIDGGEGLRQVAVFVLEKPLDAGEFEIQMLCEKYYAADLGRFRISVSTDNAPTARETPDDIEQLLQLPDAVLTSGQRARLQTEFLLEAPETADVRKKIDQLRRLIPEYRTTLAMQERSAEHRRKTFLHHRGEFTQPKEEVEPNVVAFLPPLPADAPHDRLALARWLVSRENPLTARVTANRQWAAFFGAGLVRTLGDFGSQGEPPIHPELLDWLAVQLMNDGWSLKKLDRLIVTSATYRQASRITPALLEKDPENRLLARGPRFRMDVELIRDSLLRSSGLLSEKMFGPSVFPAQPPTITTEGAYGPMTWNISQGEDRYRRSLYTFSKRTAPFAAYLAFDGPTGEVCLARRDVSNSPLQALTLMNDELFLEAAQAAGRQLAASQAASKGPIDQRLGELFRRALVRPPTAEELTWLSAFYRKQLSRFESGKLNAKALLGKGEGKEGEGSASAAQQAAWAVTARAVFNLDETVTKE
jgi:hypothetical protein